MHRFLQIQKVVINSFSTRFIFIQKNGQSLRSFLNREADVDMFFYKRQANMQERANIEQSLFFQI